MSSVSVYELHCGCGWTRNESGVSWERAQEILDQHAETDHPRAPKTVWITWEQ